ncbi:TonB-dependent receptor [Sinomicrobium sp. 2019215]|nr:TonB-dependent receptor [Sinomicrobium weinanense]
MRTNSYLVFSLLCPFFGFSQFSLTGNVKDETDPVAYANVVLQGDEGKLIAGTITDERGNFEIIADNGIYTLLISFMGYKDYKKEITLNGDISVGEIRLQENVGQLDEVVITGQRPLIEQKPDRLVYNVENSISSIGGNAANVLATAPGLMVANNSITMLGRGAPRVMINGRMLELTGDELMGFLNSLSADDIKNIEIITTPPARYDAEGNGGLININLRKGVANSWKNTLTTAYDQNTYSVFSIRNNFYYNKDKLRFSVGIGGKTGDFRGKQKINTFYPDGTWKLNYNSRNQRDNISGRTTLDYDISDNISVGGQYMGDYSIPDMDRTTIIGIHNASETLDSFLINTGYNDRSTKNHTYNAHLIAKLDTLGRKVSFDFDYFNYNAESDNRFLAETFTPEMEFLNVNMSARNTSGMAIDNFSYKVDMEHPLNFLNLSYGAKFSFIDTGADVKFFNTETGDEILDPDQSNIFDYKENTQAAYVNGTKNWGDTWSVQLGLRLENTQTEGVSETLGQSNKNDYLKLFPSFYVSYQKNENHMYSLNYGKRINRPGFWMLNPFRYYISSNSYAEGNPFLQPSFSDNFEFTHMYKGKLRTNLSLNITTDGFGTVFTAVPEENIQIITRENYYKQYQFGWSESYTADITSFWQNRNAVNVVAYKTDLYPILDAESSDGVLFYFSTNNTVSLGKSTKLQLDYWYHTPFKYGLYEIGKPMSSLNIGVKQSMFDDKLQLALLFNDILNRSQLREYNSVVNGIKQSYYEDNSNCFFRFSLIYTFGNDNTNVKQRAFGNEDERGRTD